MESAWKPSPKSNQITFILHIQGVFSLPGRGFHQRVTLDDVIVHMRQFIIALVSVDGCSSFSDPDGFLDVPDSSVGFFVYNAHSLPVYDVVFSCRMICKGGFIDGKHQSFYPLVVYFSFFVLSTSFLCSSSRVFSSLPVSPMYSAPQFLHGIGYTSSPCSSSSTLSVGCTKKRLRVVWGPIAVATPYFFSTRCTLSETPSRYGMTLHITEV